MYFDKDSGIIIKTINNNYSKLFNNMQNIFTKTLLKFILFILFVYASDHLPAAAAGSGSNKVFLLITADEPPVIIEDWMTNSGMFAGFSADISQETESAIDIEPWMTDPWRYAGTIDYSGQHAENETGIEPWMTEPLRFSGDIIPEIAEPESLVALEPWMTDPWRYAEFTGFSRTEAEPGIVIEPWMYDPCIWIRGWINNSADKNRYAAKNKLC